MDWKKIGEGALGIAADTLTGGILNGAMGLLGGLFGNKKPDAEKLQKQAWEYEKEGMALQYQYGQQAADAQQQRNLEMWNKTNYETQRQHMENAGLSVGLMYGQGGAGGATAAGGQPTQPSAPNMNPIQAALQAETIGLNLKSIQAQNQLAQAQTAKAYAEAAKTAGVDTEATKAATAEARSRIILNEWESKIKQSTEQIEAHNVTKAAAEAETAMEIFNQEVVKTEIAVETKETMIQQAIETLKVTKAEGIFKIAQKELTDKQKENIQQEIDYFFYKLETGRISADAARDQAKNTADRIAKEYEIAGQKLDLNEKQMIGDWIIAGVNNIGGLIKAYMAGKKKTK